MFIITEDALHMSDIPISEFKAIIGDLAERFPTARVDFVYPMRHGGKLRSHLGHMTKFEVFCNDLPIVRVVISHARTADLVETAEP